MDPLVLVSVKKSGMQSVVGTAELASRGAGFLALPFNARGFVAKMCQRKDHVLSICLAPDYWVVSYTLTPRPRS